MKEEAWIKAGESLAIEARAIAELAPKLDGKAFGRAVDILAAGGRVTTCASGTSGIAARKFAHSLCCIDIAAAFMPPCEAVHGGLGALKKGDAMVMVSRGGKTAELLPVIPVCARRGAKLIAVTENLESPLAAAADVVLTVRVARESDPHNIMATSSFLATVALFDALLAALIVETGYRREQFAVIHPGGAVGQALNAPGPENRRV